MRVFSDESLQLLVERHQYNLAKQSGIIGYRIRIFSDSGPEAKKEFEQIEEQVQNWKAALK